jgi:hypothetical protein
MSAALARLLDADKKVATKVIARLEHLSGYRSEDVRLLADSKMQLSRKISQLGLDPADTTSRELFHGLQAKLERDSEHLARAVGHKQSDSPEICADRLANLMNQHTRSEVLALKPAAIKDILRSVPAKRLQRHLRYRSLESMLKREASAELLAEALLIEGSSWHAAIRRELAHLSASDFERRRVSYIVMSPDRWGSLDEPVTIASLSGLVMIWPSQQLRISRSLLLVALLYEASKSLEVDSYYLRMNQFRGDFGKLAAKLAVDGTYEQLSIFDSQIFNWGNLKHLFEGSSELPSIHPALKFWAGDEHLIHSQNEPISMHLADHVKQHDFSAHSPVFARHGLKSELLARYAQHDGVKDYLQTFFDDTFIAMEPELATEPVMALQG